MLKKLSIFFICILLNTNLCADVITDGTLGRVVTLPGSNFLITPDLGQQVGSNLFHSFSKFNIDMGESAIFSGSDSINNVISRVTGGDSSTINGILESRIPNADVYLINPAGLIFGQGAKLEVQGAFHASTANVLYLENGGRFDVTNPKNSLLTVEPPEAFGFLGNAQGTITVKDSYLEIRENRTLSMVGGTLKIEDSIMFTPNGQMNLIATGNNELQIANSTLYAPSGKIIAMASENVTIPSSSEVLAAMSFEQGGTIRLSEKSSIMERLQKLSKYLPMSPSLSKYVAERPKIQIGGPKPEEIVIVPDPLGNIDVNGKDGGQVFIRAGQFFLNYATIFADTLGGNGKNGIINIAIDINIDGKMRLENSSRITAGNFGTSQNSGRITIETKEPLFVGLTTEYLRGFLNFSKIPPHVTITELMQTQEGFKEFFVSQIMSTIGTNNFNSGTGGNIQITTPELEVAHGLIESATEGSGEAGNIEIKAQKINLHDYGLINAATGSNPNPAILKSGSGQAGKITINATDSISLSNFSTLSVGAEKNTTGNAGTLDLTTSNLTLNSGSEINAFSYGGGNAGTINITANTALLTGGGLIHAESKNNKGGNITLDVRESLHLTDGGWITTGSYSKEGEYGGGDITIGNPQFALQMFTLGKDSGLWTRGNKGDGGNLYIYADDLNVSGNAMIDVSSEFGLNGQVWINDLELNENFMILPPDFLIVDSVLNNRCAGFSKENMSRFLVIARDALPPAPTDLRTHLYVPQ